MPNAKRVTKGPAYAVCPRVESGSTRTPKPFKSISAATRFLNCEVEQPLEREAEATGLSLQEVRAKRAEHRAKMAKTRLEMTRKVKSGELHPLPLAIQPVRNRDQGWQGPVVISRMSDYSGPKCNRTFRGFLPPEAIGPLPSLRVEELIDRALEGRSEDYKCYLANDWRFEEIHTDAWKRVGHEYEGRQHRSVAEIVIKAVYDLEAALQALHPAASCKAHADFWRSWQVQQHIADFCGRLAESGTMRALGLGVLDALSQTDCVRVYAYRQLAAFAHELMSSPDDRRLVATHQAEPAQLSEDESRRVFVVHGRNLKARDAMCSLLRAVDLEPIEWPEAVSFTGEGSPFSGQVVEEVFSHARAVVVLITGDDLARLGTRFQTARDADYEKQLTPQARPNVLFEAGMAFGRHPERTILVNTGHSRPFSDVAGRNAINISNRPEDRQALIGRLRSAGCPVKTELKQDWLSVGDFDAALEGPDL